MDNHTKEIKVIFSEAYKKKTLQERKDYLDRRCGSDADLRADVESLLEAYDGAEGFMDAPLLNAEVSLGSSPVSEGPGSTIGPYKLLEKIGEGGMAVVYMAEQEMPLRRKVALKIIKLGMDTAQVIARFEAERQALALMDHPHIAKVLDAGATDTGRPYFVMELVQGVSITDYCDQNKVSTKERLTLFIQVCQAAQHAHQKGIIHRDIKPTNIMVTQHEGKPVPKVIDFGIAKATNQRLTEKTLFTRYAHIIGTPAYMSPEQAELSDLDIDTRSDIYSLGVLLYEFLTGTTPFSEDELRKAGYAEMTRIIREQEPPRPSTRLTQMLAGSGRDRKLATCHSPLATDLDWIVMKTLEKDRARRYDTASALALDVQRHLDNEPILARAPSTLYRLQKFLRRHQYQAIAALVITALFVALVAMLLVWNQYRLQIAETESIRHEKTLSRAREFFAKADYAVALNETKSILPSKHVGSDAQLLYASILVESYRPAEAVSALQNLLGARREIAGTAHALLARILWEEESRNMMLEQKEQVQRIEEHRQRAEELLPKTAHAYFLRAMVALTIKEKLEWLDKALSIDPRHYESYRLRAFTYSASRRYESMERDTFAMILLKPGDPLGYSLRALALRELGRYEEAMTNYDRAVEHTAQEDREYAELNAERCAMLIRMGQYGSAIEAAQDCLHIWPNATILQFHACCALTALGEYETATVRYHQMTGNNPDSKREFRAWAQKYVFDALAEDRSWHPPDHEPDGVAFLAMLEAEETYVQLSVKATRIIGNGFAPTWSPDGTKLAFSLGVRGHSGLGVFDLTSQETEILTVPGKNPRWSPDGQYIAFVRDVQKLPISKFGTVERWRQLPSYENDTVWIIKPDGTGLKRLARGGWPSWSQDSTHIYYQSRMGRMLHSVSVEDAQAGAKSILTCSNFYPSVSPDNEYMAYVEGQSLKILDLASPTDVAVWKGPPGVWGGSWAPASQEFALGGENSPETRTGLWIFDLDDGQAKKVLNGQITMAAWAPDMTKLAFSLGPPFFDIWIADLDPNISTIDALEPVCALEAHCEQMLDLYSRRIEADPQDADSYLRRAQYYDFLNDKENVVADMRDYFAVLDPSTGTNGHNRWLRDWLTGLWMSTPVNLGATINTHAADGGPCISSDGLELYFYSFLNGWADGPLRVATRNETKDPWSEAVSLESQHNLGTAPCISADGQSLYFDSDRTEPGGSDIWVATRASVSDAWSDPVNLGPSVNSAAIDMGASVSADGLELYFGSCRPGGSGFWDIYVTTRSTPSGPWSTAVNLGPTVNSESFDGLPCICPNGLALFFTSDRAGGYGDLDIWVTTQATTNDDWGTPMNLGPAINTSAGEGEPAISADGREFYFSDWWIPRPGGVGDTDLWQVSITPVSGSFQEGNDDSTRTTVESKSGKEGL